jgi:hypothetical protein
MKPFLNSTTEQLAAELAHFCSTIRAKLSCPDGFEYRPRRHVPRSVDSSRIPAYLRLGHRALDRQRNRLPDFNFGVPSMTTPTANACANEGRR